MVRSGHLLSGTSIAVLKFSHGIVSARCYDLFPDPTHVESVAQRCAIRGQRARRTRAWA